MEINPANADGARPRRRWRLWIAAGVGAVVTIVTALEIQSLMSPTKTFAMGRGLQAKDTEFTVHRCRDNPGEEGIPSHRTGLQFAVWDHNGHFVVRYAVATNCAAPFNYGGYRLLGDKLTLEYSVFWKSVQMPDGRSAVIKTACTCGYELTYRIAGLTRKDYSIDIIEVEKR
jgi:hypothetical protein